MPLDFSHRSLEPEIMDGGVGSYDALDEALRQIEAVNALTLGYRPIINWLDDIAPKAGQPLHILDVGCGRGALLRQIAKWGQKRRIALCLTGIDIEPLARTAAENSTPPGMDITYRTLNAFDLREGGADIILCSHMTHHLKDAELLRLLDWLERNAAMGWAIVDLHRHPLAWLLAKALLAVLPVRPMLRNDGALSVERAFTRRDWWKFLREAGIPRVGTRIEWFFPFRHRVSRWKA